MNNQQRNFLTKKIDENRTTAVQMLDRTRPKCPSLSNYLWKYAVEGTLQIQPEATIKEAIRQMALKAEGSGHDWLQENHWGGSARRSIEIKINDLLVVPKEYQDAYEEYKRQEQEINEQIYQINTQADTLITRITLASDSVLNKLVNEVDDMGSLSLMDTKLKQLTQ